MFKSLTLIKAYRNILFSLYVSSIGISVPDNTIDTSPEDGTDYLRIYIKMFSTNF